MLAKQVKVFGNPVEIRCDGRCSKAWGISNRPCINFDPNDPGNIAWLSDDEIKGDAPADPGTYEGGQGKPSATDLMDPVHMNKWCFRECERCVEAPKMPFDFTKRLYNQP